MEKQVPRGQSVPKPPKIADTDVPDENPAVPAPEPEPAGPPRTAQQQAARKNLDVAQRRVEATRKKKEAADEALAKVKAAAKEAVEVAEEKARQAQVVLDETIVYRNYTGQSPLLHLDDQYVPEPEPVEVAEADDADTDVEATDAAAYDAYAAEHAIQTA